MYVWIQIESYNSIINTIMKQPKYNIGDKVFFIEYNKIVEASITGVFTRYTKDGGDKIKDHVYFIEKKDRVDEYRWQNEVLLFTSREELIKSL